MANLDKYLLEFKFKNTKKRYKSSFAMDAKEHNEIVYKYTKFTNVKNL